MLSLKKDKFPEKIFSMLGYRAQAIPLEELRQMILAPNTVDIIAGDFNYDLLKVSNKLLKYLKDYIQVVKEGTNISRSLITMFT